MIRRLGIAQALINRPRILVLDEPTAGLDPKERVRFRKMIARQGENNIVLLSTHIVSDVEQIADKILMMKEGQLIFEGTRQETGSDLEKLYLEKFGEVKGCVVILKDLRVRVSEAFRRKSYGSPLEL